MDWKQVKYDVIVVGSGATGAIAASRLTKGGAKVLLLEAGPEFPPTLCGPAERTLEEFNAFKVRQPIQSRSLLYGRTNCHLFIDDLDNPYTTESDTRFNWIRSRQAGGRTLVWSRLALRMSEQDLAPAIEEAPETGWPVSYRDLAPYYDEIEKLIGVCGTVENIASLPDGCYLPRAVPPYLDDLRRNLAKRFPERHLLPSREVVGHRSSEEVELPSYTSLSWLFAGAVPERLTFRTNCVVATVELARPDLAGRVVFFDCSDRCLYDVAGRVIVLCASTIESIRILLASVSRDFPIGLGNSSGTLGHYLMDHFGGPRVVALGKVTGIEPGQHERAYIPRFCNMVGRTEGFNQGYGIQADFEAQSHDNMILTMGVFGEVLPYFDNSVELNRKVTDSCGLVVPKIRFRYLDNERQMALHAQGALREIVDAIGFRPMIVRDELLTPGTRAHELGGARMGSRPETAVLNSFNQCWDIKNLFVTDGACFPRAGYKGPTLTMMALTARACDKILSLLGSGAL